MGKKGHGKAEKKKLTKKEKKQQSHLKLVKGKGEKSTDYQQDDKKKKAA